jgi:AraC-like DNA-binding protein
MPGLGLPVVQEFVHDLMVSTVQRPPGLRAGFHAEVGDPVSGLHHAGEQWAPARFLITPHTHPVWELYLQVHGLTRWMAGGQLVTLQPGHLLGVAPGVEHHMPERSGGNHHFYFAAINVATVLARRPALAPAWQNVPPVVHRADGQLLAGSFDQLIRELTARRRFAADGLALAVDRLLLEVSRLLVPGRPAPELAAHPAIMRVQDLLDRDYAHRWTLRELSDRVGLAPTYLAGQFTADVGQAPHQYLLQRRVERARQLLETSELSITAIGLEVGFGSGQHLARVFRRLTGCTPREYRRSAGTIAPAAPGTRP